MMWTDLCKEGSPIPRVKKTEEDRRLAHCRRQKAYKARKSLLGGPSSAGRLPEPPLSFIWMPLPMQPWASSSTAAACASVAALPAAAILATSADRASSPACASSAVSAFSAACASSVAFASAASCASAATCASSAAFDGDVAAVAAVAPSPVADFTSAAVLVAVAAVGENDNKVTCGMVEEQEVEAMEMEAPAVVRSMVSVAPKVAVVEAMEVVDEDEYKIVDIISIEQRFGWNDRWLVRWQACKKSYTNFEPRVKIPADMLEVFEQKRMAIFNTELEPLLAGSSAPSGVVGLTVSDSDALSCAVALEERWKLGCLQLRDESGKLHGTLRGFGTYGKTLQKVKPKEQRDNTLLVTKNLLPLVSRFLPGFEKITEALASWLEAYHETSVEFFEAHILRQGPATQSSTSFSAHQDTEQHTFIEYTAIIKLTPDEQSERPSTMRVVGAPCHFQYGPRAGAGGCFRSRLYHASVIPESEREHLKIAFFFQKLDKGGAGVDVGGEEGDGGEGGESGVDRGGGRVGERVGEPRQSARNLRQTPSLQGPALQPEEVAGTLANGAVFIKDSSLGKHAGLGLFAGLPFAAGDRITSYEGVIRYREEINERGLDGRYLMTPDEAPLMCGPLDDAPSMMPPDCFCQSPSER